MANRWLINNVALVRNPDTFVRKADKANVTYAKMASGKQRRVSVPKLVSANDIEFGWKAADERLRTSIFALLNRQGAQVGISKIEIGGKLPRRHIYAYIDTPEDTMSAELFGDSRVGQGAIRHDLKLFGRTDGPYDHSVAVVPQAPVSPAYIISAFSGPTGSNAIDGLPTWNGNPWNGVLPSGSLAIAVSNLGTTEWSPTIIFHGPFTTLSMTATYEDVDGTGAGVTFNYSGPAVAATDFVYFDTFNLRLYASVGGVLNEIYDFSVLAVSSNSPFPYFPPLQPGASTLTLACAGSDGVNTTYDLTNNATETFRYW